MKITINTYIQLQEELRRLDELFVREEVNEEEYKSRNIEINKVGKSYGRDVVNMRNKDGYVNKRMVKRGYH